MGRVVALDPGAVRFGVAVSNSDRTMAFPRPFIPRDDEWVASVAAVVTAEVADLVVIGLPVALSGDASAARTTVTEIRRQIEAAVPSVTTEVVDERFTTTIAANALRDAGLTAREQRGRIDSAAAVVLLQGYLDALPH